MWQRTAEIARGLHAVSHRLHPFKVEALGLVATVQAHCRAASREGLCVHVSDSNVPSAIRPEVEVCLFRVLEEALNNVVRHAAAARADVQLLGGADGSLVLRVSDAGRGFAPGGSRSTGLGLIVMRERLRGVGGSLSVTSSPGTGTVVEARVPQAAATPVPDKLNDPGQEPPARRKRTVKKVVTEKGTPSAAPARRAECA
jgi:signal transduction histidine kinase